MAPVEHVGGERPSLIPARSDELLGQTVQEQPSKNWP